MGENDEDWTTTERVARVTYLLCRGEKLTVRQVALSTGISPEGARSMLCAMSRRIPILSLDGHWMMADMAEVLYVSQYSVN